MDSFLNCNRVANVAVSFLLDTLDRASVNFHNLKKAPISIYYTEQEP
jgi:hypothetical protein